MFRRTGTTDDDVDFGIGRNIHFLNGTQMNADLQDLKKYYGTRINKKMNKIKSFRAKKNLLV